MRNYCRRHRTGLGHDGVDDLAAVALVAHPELDYDSRGGRAHQQGIAGAAAPERLKVKAHRQISTWNAGNLETQTFDELVRVAGEAVATTIRNLPAPLRERVRTIPICYERHPSPAMVEDGVADDVMGLFVGNTLADQAAGESDLPGQIILFLATIMEESGGDRKAFLQEVRTTLLHELGHYLGLNELELRVRGLE